MHRGYPIIEVGWAFVVLNALIRGVCNYFYIRCLNNYVVSLGQEIISLTRV